MSAEQPDYFTNHSYKLRFPWRLYHGPIISALQNAIDSSTGPEVLNLGSGPFLELPLLKREGRNFTACDVDERAIVEAKRRYGAELKAADVVVPGQPLPYPDGTFDLVTSMDVIEHIVDPIPWVREALRVLKPKGQLFLTTPNYSSFSLRLLEATVLEVIARRQGFSRHDIHPTKMTPERLERVLREAGCSQVSVGKIAQGWVLTALAGTSS
jgi:2-polyprenyl-3-methyl-5-hydroxy-6-metoxy-1,4-benzoquinol methylase